jgi:hypothetical protein
MNQALWFTQKLHNEILAMQRKVGRLGNTLIGPTLTIIGTYYLNHFVENLKKIMTTGIRSQFSNNRVVIDVRVVMLEPRQKRSSRMNKPTHPKQLEVSLMQEGDIDNPFVNRQEESTSLELEIGAIGKGNNAKKGGKFRDF